MYKDILTGYAKVHHDSNFQHRKYYIIYSVYAVLEYVSVLYVTLTVSTIII